MVSCSSLRMVGAAWAVFAWLGAAGSARAQTVVGSVTDPSGAPLTGAFVRLLGAGGASRAAVLTDALGRYEVRVPGPGVYRLRVEFIGRQPDELGPLELAEGQTFTWSPRLAPRPIAIAGVEVEGRRRCEVRPEEGTAAARLWEEARTALDIAAWGRREGLFRYELVRRARELDPDDRRVLRAGEEERLDGYYRQPFVSRPPDELMRRGFVQSRRDGTFAYAPDAEVLLSDAFTESHCFGVRAEEGRVGLTFEPTRERSVPDIRGVLWLDAESSELQAVEYRYTRFPGVDPRHGLGGRVEFARLPTGAWIVRRWKLELPVRAEVRRPGAADVRDYPLVAIREEGGEVLRVLDAEGRPVLVAEGGTVTGAVFDSVRGAPLAGARVTLEGTDYGTRTAADGSFLVAGVAEGRYTLAVAHPRLDSLAVGLLRRTVTVPSGSAVRAPLVLSPTQPRPAGSETRLEGELLDRDGDSPLAGGLVTIFDASGLVFGEELTDAWGRWTVELPAGGAYRVRAEWVGREAWTSELLEVEGDSRRLTSHRVVAPLVRLGPPSQEDVDSTSCEVDAGAGEAVGRIWREARKALTILVRAQELERVAYRIFLETRHEPAPGSPVEEWAETRPVPGAVGHRFDPVPVDAEGRPRFVQPGDSSLATSPPGPRFLLSEWFRRNYCLALVPEGGGPGTVALDYHPVGRGHTDVRGMLVLDATSLALRSHHYRYLDFPVEQVDPLPGGRMEFSTLTNGVVFLREWAERLPLVARIREAGAPRNLARTALVAGFVVERGQVSRAEPTDGSPFWFALADDTGKEPSDPWAPGARLDENLRRGGPSRGVAAVDSPAGPTVPVTGAVRARESGEPIAAAEVRLGAAGPVLTDDQGRFTLRVPPGRQLLRVEALGREAAADTLVVAPDRPLELRVALGTGAIELDPLTVEVEARNLALERVGFYDRRLRGIASVLLGPVELEKRERGNRIADLLTGLPGVTLVPSVGVPGAMIPRMSGSSTDFLLNPDPSLPRGCEPDVYLDGVLQYDRLRPPAGHPRLLDINVVPPSLLAGVEVYAGATAPGEFPPSDCGLILLWTGPR